MERLPDMIDTERTRLRPFRFDDVDDVVAYAADPEWARFLPVPQPYTKEDAKTFIARQVLQDRTVHPIWAIEISGTVVGGINLRLTVEHRFGELGYSVARAHWRQGYATEVAQVVIDEAFTRLKELNRVQAMADARNIASQRVMEKCGMKREGVLRQKRCVRGAFVDEVWYGLLREEWEG